MRTDKLNNPTCFHGQELRFSPKYSPDYAKNTFSVTGRVKRIGDTMNVSATALANTISGLHQACEMVVDFCDRPIRSSTGVIQMAKFYVQSGSIRGIVDCYDSECAAVWIVNRAMEQIVPINDETGFENENDDNVDVGMFALDDSIQVSEQGFHRDDCEIIDTHLAFVHWHQLKRAIEAIHQQLNDKIDND